MILFKRITLGKLIYVKVLCKYMKIGGKINTNANSNLMWWFATDLFTMYFSVFYQTTSVRLENQGPHDWPDCLKE